MTRVTRQFIRITAVLAILAVAYGCKSDSKPSPPKPDSAAQTLTKGQDSLVIELAGADQTSALDLLKADHDVDYRSTAVGAFVTQVDQAESGAEYFWMYSVNDSFPTTACDKFVTSDGDRVVWHFRKMGR
jgi:hypothetical protein